MKNRLVGGDVIDLSEIMGVSVHCIDGRKMTHAQFFGLLKYRDRQKGKI